LAVGFANAPPIATAWTWPLDALALSFSVASVLLEAPYLRF
jgi:hypothetical protein